MIISVELIAVRSPLIGSGGALEIENGATLSQALGRLNLPGGETYMTIVNDTAIGPDDRAGRALSEGDAVTVFPPIKGGVNAGDGARRFRVPGPPRGPADRQAGARSSTETGHNPRW